MSDAQFEVEVQNIIDYFFAAKVTDEARVFAAFKIIIALFKSNRKDKYTMLAALEHMYDTMHFENENVKESTEEKTN